MDKFEYSIKAIEVGSVNNNYIDTFLVTELNKLGQLGWEVVSLGKRGSMFKFYLKRKIREYTPVNI